MRVAIFCVACLAFVTTTLSSAIALSDLTASAAANVRPNVNFLDQSSRLAISRSDNPRLKAFARKESEEQTAVANAIVAWTQAVTSAGAAEALGLPPPEEPPHNALDPGAVTPSAVDPTRLSALGADLTQAPEGVLSGRSVAVETPPPGDHKTILPAGSDNLSKLTSLRGKAFDRLYKSSQHDALLQLSTLYTAYIQHGDDDALRNLAVRQLPSVNRRLSELQKL